MNESIKNINIQITINKTIIIILTSNNPFAISRKFPFNICSGVKYKCDAKPLSPPVTSSQPIIRVAKSIKL